jgi:hypothetical protein
MGRLTLRLPDSLHHELEVLAEQEQVSLNQYIVYALTRQAVLGYTVQPVPEKAIAEQKAAYSALLQSLGSSSFAEIQAVLAEREPAEPDPGLTPEVVSRLQQRIAEERRGVRKGANVIAGSKKPAGEAAKQSPR